MITTIAKQGNEAIITSTVLDYSNFESTLNNVKNFVNNLPINELNNLFESPDKFNKIPENRALLNILNGIDFQEVGLSELSDFTQLIKVIGLDNYELYSIPEYSYMYTNLVEYFDEY